MATVLRIGAVIPQGWLGDFPADASGIEIRELMVETALRLEKAGLYSGWLYDHFHPFGIPDQLKHQQPVMECWTSLAFLSQATGKLRLGPLVTCQSYRAPSLLAKMAATLDQISAGRLEFGIGAGWYREEYEAYGYKFPELRVRIEELEEAVQIIRLVWTQRRASLDGKHYRVTDAICEPKPVQKPHPKVMVGGESERTLKVVAKYGDRCNLSGGREKYREKIALLTRLCENVGRRAEEVEKTAHTTLLMSESKRELEEMLLRFYRDRGQPGESLSSFEDRVRTRAVVGEPSEVGEMLEEMRKLRIDYVVFNIRDLIRSKFAQLEHLEKIVSGLES